MGIHERRKTIDRVSKTGFAYKFSEGPIAFPDPLDRPGRTMLTSEGTKTEVPMLSKTRIRKSFVA